MSNIWTGPKSIREVAIERLVAKLASMQAGTPANDPYEFTADKVIRTPLFNPDGGRVTARGDQLALSVIEGLESKLNPEVGLGNFVPRLEVAIEWSSSFLSGVDDDIVECNNRILANLVRRVKEDVTLGGITVNIQEVSNQLFIEDYADRITAGTLILQIQYKHRAEDPRRLASTGGFLSD